MVSAKVQNKVTLFVF